MKSALFDLDPVTAYRAFARLAEAIGAARQLKPLCERLAAELRSTLGAEGVELTCGEGDDELSVHLGVVVPLPNEEGALRTLRAPLRAAGSPVGLLTVCAPANTLFAAGAQAFVTTVAGLIAPAVQLLRSTSGIAPVDVTEAKDRFIRIASHELRSPISSLEATLALIELDPTSSQPERRATLMARLTRQVHRLHLLVNQLIDTARLSGGELPLERTEVDLVALCREVIGLHVESGHLIHLEEEGPVVGRWDAGRIEQVITNLLSNAERYSRGGSAITVRVRGDGERALISVSDEGVGIPAAEIEQIMEPFFRASNASQMSRVGLGLGLHIAAEIVRRHRGMLQVSSELGRGSTFTIELPRG